MKSLAQELSNTYWREKKSGTPKSFEQIISVLYKKYKDRFPEFRTFRSFKSALLKKYWEKPPPKKEIGPIILWVTPPTKGEQYPSKEIDDQIDSCDLNRDSYWYEYEEDL